MIEETEDPNLQQHFRSLSSKFFDVALMSNPSNPTTLRMQAKSLLHQEAFRQGKRKETKTKERKKQRSLIEGRRRVVLRKEKKIKRFTFDLGVSFPLSPSAMSPYYWSSTLRYIDFLYKVALDSDPFDSEALFDYSQVSLVPLPSLLL